MTTSIFVYIQALACFVLPFFAERLIVSCMQVNRHKSPLSNGHPAVRPAKSLTAAASELCHGDAPGNGCDVESDGDEKAIEHLRASLHELLDHTIP